MKIKLFVCLLATIFLIKICNFQASNIGTKTVHTKSEHDLSKYATTDSISKSISPLSEEDFIISDKNNYIELGSDIDDLKTNDKIIMFSPCSEIHAYEVYVYENFKIMNSLNIWEIDLTTPVLQTSRGIKVGDTISDVIEKYGEAETDCYEYYQYTYKSRLIIFYIEAGKVSKIEFDLYSV